MGSPQYTSTPASWHPNSISTLSHRKHHPKLAHAVACFQFCWKKAEVKNGQVSISGNLGKRNKIRAIPATVHRGKWTSIQWSCVSAPYWTGLNKTRWILWSSVIGYSRKCNQRTYSSHLTGLGIPISRKNSVWIVPGCGAKLCICGYRLGIALLPRWCLSCWSRSMPIGPLQYPK